jgi:hypothetical protein
VRLRQARLKSKHWSLYPKVQSGLWHEAGSLVRNVLYHHPGRPTFASLAGRPLPAAHFDFRYGDPPRGGRDANARSRWNDVHDAPDATPVR